VVQACLEFASSFQHQQHTVEVITRLTQHLFNTQLQLTGTVLIIDQARGSVEADSPLMNNRAQFPAAITLHWQGLPVPVDVGYWLQGVEHALSSLLCHASAGGVPPVRDTVTRLSQGRLPTYKRTYIPAHSE